MRTDMRGGESGVKPGLDGDERQEKWGFRRGKRKKESRNLQMVKILMNKRFQAFSMVVSDNQVSNQVDNQACNQSYQRPQQDL